MGLFFQKLQQAVSDKGIGEILDIITYYNGIIEDVTLRKGLADLPVQNNIQMELLKEITDERYFMGINRSVISTALLSF